MKYLKYCAIGLVFLLKININIAQNNPYDDKDKERISKNKISAATLWLYKYKSGVPEEIGNISWSAKYDRFGNHTEDKNYLTLGSKGDRFVYKYDYNKTQSPIEKQWYDPDGKLFKRMVYTYDAKENLISETHYNADTTTESRTIYIYNSKGLLVQERTYAADSTLENKWVYEYDWQDYRSAALEYVGKDSTFESKTTYLHNHRGKLVAQELFDKFLKRQKIYICNYDGQMQKNEELWFDSENKLVTRIVYQYDNLGNKSETIEYNGLGIPITLLKYKYEFYK